MAVSMCSSPPRVVSSVNPSPSSEDSYMSPSPPRVVSSVNPSPSSEDSYMSPSPPREASFKSPSPRTPPSISPSPPREVTCIEEAQELIENIVEELKKKLPLKCGLGVSSVALGGGVSLGTCSQNKFDSQLIVYSKDVDSKKVERKGYRDWLKKIQELFQHDEVLSECYQFHGLTAHSLQFLMDGVEIELMVSPAWGRPGNFYTFMETIKPQNRKEFFICAGKWQMQFLRQHLNQTQDCRREFIHRAKSWREEKWPQCTEGKGRPSDYLLSLLVVKAYEDATKRLGVFSALSPDTMAHHTMEEIKRIVNNHRTIDIYWEYCYSLNQYPTLIPPRPPRILDPANPANNVYMTGISSYKPSERYREHHTGDGDWTNMKRYIGSLDLTRTGQH